MNLGSFQSKWRGNVETKTTTQSTLDLSPKHKTSEISLKTSDLMLKHQKWQHWPTLLHWKKNSPVDMYVLSRVNCHIHHRYRKTNSWT